MTLLKVKDVPLSIFDSEARGGGQQASRTLRSWWALRYTDGRIVHEWDADPGSPNGHADWARVPSRGRQSIRLYCPNGKMAQLGDSDDATGKLFQFKIGQRDFAIVGPGATIQTQRARAHVIGMLTGSNGECVLASWELLPAPEIPASSPRAPVEAEWIAKSAEPGLFEKAVQQWEKEFDRYCQTMEYRVWAQAYRAWERNKQGRLVGPIDDNVYAMRYQLIGRMNADHLGIDDGEGR